MLRDLFARLTGDRREIHDVNGFRVVVENTRDDIATSDVLARLRESLELIDQTQPWRLRHMRRDLREFWVIRYACRGAYFPQERACMTELTFLARRDITAATVASSIIHEGMHARVHRFAEQFGDGWPRDRAREERLCRKAELQFGQSLPSALGAPVISRAMESLTLSDAEVAPDVDWNIARARVDDVDRGNRGW